MRKVFTYYADPGHSWIKVPMAIVKELGIELMVSTYSYYRKGYAYLEEDQDAALFIHAMKKANKEVEFRESHTNNSSRIRNYPYYNSKKVRRKIK